MLLLNDQFNFITSMDSLNDAHKFALKGKRNNCFATKFDHNLISNLLSLQASLRNQTYKPLPYRNKVIYEPKARLIQAPSYRDCIVHHAIYSVLAPFYERSFVRDSYACRVDLGIHAAAHRAQHFLRSYGSSSNIYICQLDISKFYASINHDKLMA
jgi:retron-type reverse transcriptase